MTGAPIYGDVDGGSARHTRFPVIGRNGFALTAAHMNNGVESGLAVVSDEGEGE